MFKDRQKIATVCLFITAEIFMGLVSSIGYVRTPVVTVTIMHLPVILAGILMGPKIGGIIGFSFGLTALVNASFMAISPAESLVFSPFHQNGQIKGIVASLIVCFVPRILVGVFAGAFFEFLSTETSINNTVKLIYSSVIGSLTNSVLVLLGIFLFFRKPYAAAINTAERAVDELNLWDVFTEIISFNGLIEVGVAVVAVLLVGQALLKARDNKAF